MRAVGNIILAIGLALFFFVDEAKGFGMMMSLVGLAITLIAVGMGKSEVPSDHAAPGTAHSPPPSQTRSPPISSNSISSPTATGITLFPCAACGRGLSPSAHTCPGCGHPANRGVSATSEASGVMTDMKAQEHSPLESPQLLPRLPEVAPQPAKLKETQLLAPGTDEQHHPRRKLVVVVAVAAAVGLLTFVLNSKTSAGQNKAPATAADVCRHVSELAAKAGSGPTSGNEAVALRGCTDVVEDQLRICRLNGDDAQAFMECELERTSLGATDSPCKQKCKYLVLGADCFGGDKAACQLACTADDTLCAECGAYLIDSGDGALATMGAEMLESLCKNGHDLACFHFASALTEGHGIARDAARAKVLLTDCCAKRNGDCCHNLGVALHTPSEANPMPNLAAAAAAYTKGCDLETLMSCTSLAAMLNGGAGVAQNLDMARVLARKACDGGESAACELLPAIGK